MIKTVNFIALASALALSEGLYAQNTPATRATAIVTAGGELTARSSGGASASYSIGQVVYTAFTASGGSVSQGILQGYTITPLSVADDIKLSLSAYPNPATDVLVLEAPQRQVPLRYRLYDTQGVTLAQSALESQAHIQMGDLPSAIYFIQIMDGSAVIQTFKIVKQ